LDKFLSIDVEDVKIAKRILLDLNSNYFMVTSMGRFQGENILQKLVLAIDYGPANLWVFEKLEVCLLIKF
jgi:hypothetical protein